jgi:hypothetical protein
VTVHALTAGQGFDMTARRVLHTAAFAPSGPAVPAPPAWSSATLTMSEGRTLQRRLTYSRTLILTREV